MDTRSGHSFEVGSLVRRTARRSWFAALALVVAVACGGGDSTSSTQKTLPESTCDGTFASVQQIFEKSCTTAGCHVGATPAAAMDLSGGSAEALVGVSSGTCDGWQRVVPGDPEQSLLWRKLYSVTPPCGDTMPLGGHLKAVDLACIREWIQRLPQLDGGPGPSGGGGDACETCGGSTCVDLSADPAHCGSCNTRCPAGSACTDGTCACDGSLSLCSGVCVDLQSSQEHCGACGTACPTGGLCASGQCLCSGALEACGGACVDTQSDPAHCGSCGKACGASAPVCLGGVCSTGCGSLTNCGGACVDLTASVGNCGACGVSCPSGASCANGQCACPAGTADCGGTCRDVFSDPSNCGACGTVCGSGQVCNAGACECPGGGAVCGGRCVDTQSDPANCGACGNTCGGGQTCSSGACVCASASASFASDVQPIFTKSCALRGCHGSVLPKEGLNLSSGAAYANLVGVKATECSGRLRVAPGDPAASYLMNKLMGVNLCFGSQMPKAGASIPKAELDMIGAWICAGAANN